jgi:hypothetical protein
MVEHVVEAGDCDGMEGDLIGRNELAILPFTFIAVKPDDKTTLEVT